MYPLVFLFLLSLTNNAISAPTSQCEDICRPEVRRFQEFIAINTTTGEDFRPAVDFWKRLAKQENVQIHVYEYVRNNPVIVLKYPGLDSSLSSILLNAHIDVVPAYYETGWTYPPFSGSVNDQCEIVGRGTQVMKSNAIQYFEAMNRLKNNNIKLLRDVYIVLTPDETTGSANGEARFVKSEEFQDMNVGFAFTVGTPAPSSAVSIFYQDKTTWALRVDCFGQTTTSGIFLNPNITSEGTCSKFYISYTQFKERQYRKSLTSSDSGTYTVMNYVGGYNPITYSANAPHFNMFFAIALSHQTSVQEFNRTLQQWARRAGGDIRLTTEVLIERATPTKVDSSNPYWVALKEVFEELNIPLNPTTSPLATDANFVVSTGVPSFGLSPQPNTPVLIYAINERLSIRTFLEGICIYEQVIKRFADLPYNQVGDNPKRYLKFTKN